MAHPSIRRGRCPRGVTLVETMAAVGVIAVAAAVAVMTAGPVVQPAAARTATQQLVSDLRLTRMKAIAQHRRFRVAIDADGGTYTVERDAGGGIFVTDEGPFTLPGTAVFGDVTPGDPVFDARGGANAVTTITVSAPHANPRTVTIGVLGQVEVS
jgi:prepilin-type N-terminal cleavage/methylation domain-containing protein